MAELHRSKTELEAQTDLARSAANQAVRDKERALHEKGIQEQKAAFLEAEVSRTSAALQQERRSHAAEVRLPCRCGANGSRSFAHVVHILCHRSLMCTASHVPV